MTIEELQGIARHMKLPLKEGQWATRQGLGAEQFPVAGHFQAKTAWVLIEGDVARMFLHGVESSVSQENLLHASNVVYEVR